MIVGSVLEQLFLLRHVYFYYRFNLKASLKMAVELQQDLVIETILFSSYEIGCLYQASVKESAFFWLTLFFLIKQNVTNKINHCFKESRTSHHSPPALSFLPSYTFPLFNPQLSNIVQIIFPLSGGEQKFQKTVGSQKLSLEQQNHEFRWQLAKQRQECSIQYKSNMFDQNKEWKEILKKDLSCIIEKESQQGAVYLSSLPTAQCLPLLQANNITSVISAAKGVRLTSVAPYLRSHLILPAEDSPNYDIGQFFDSSFQFIESNRKRGGVLVHCMAGISRSSAILAAYLIKKEGISTSEAVTRLQQKRKQVSPNEGFMEQLNKYQKEQNKRMKGRIKTEGEGKKPCQKMPFSTLFDQNQSKNLVAKQEQKIMKKGERMVESNLKEESNESVRDCSAQSKRTRGSSTLQKIEKMKKSMLVGMVNEKLQGQKTFRKLLGNNIYKNKLKLR